MAVEEQSEPEHTLAQHQVRVMIVFVTLSCLPVVLTHVGAECGAALHDDRTAPNRQILLFGLSSRRTDARCHMLVAYYHVLITST